jgi:hypothetical protein
MLALFLSIFVSCYAMSAKTIEFELNGRGDVDGVLEKMKKNKKGNIHVQQVPASTTSSSTSSISQTQHNPHSFLSSRFSLSLPIAHA